MQTLLEAREPPHNFEAEQALLGALLQSRSAWEQVAEIVAPEHFADPLHGQIYRAIATLCERGQGPSAVALKSWIEANPDAREAGGAAYLARLAAQAVLVHEPAAFAGLVRDLHLRRQIIVLANTSVASAHAVGVEEEKDALAQIEAMERSLYELAGTGQAERGVKSSAQALAEAMAAAEAAYQCDGRLSGVATGLAPIDELLGGLHKSDLVILAGRPSMGKTALATNIAFHAARREAAPVAFFSLEMSAAQLMTRIVSEQALLPSERIRRGRLTTHEFDRMLTEADSLGDLPLHIDDTAALSVAQIRTRARRVKRRHGLGLVVVDYLQLVASARRLDSRVNEVAEVTRGLKTLAKELDVPVLALSQLNRAVEARPDKRPQLADLRDSGSIEQDADVVMFVYRDEYYLVREEPKRDADETDDRFARRRGIWQERLAAARGKAEVIVAKQRHGPTGEVMLAFDGAFTRFSTPPEEPQPLPTADLQAHSSHPASPQGADLKARAPAKNGRPAHA